MTSHIPSPTPTRQLAQALTQNDSVQETIEQSADELLMVNAVLKTELPANARSADVVLALQKSHEIEDRIADSAEELAEVNELLHEEIDERIDLERKLLASEAALAKTKTALHQQINASTTRG